MSGSIHRKLFITAFVALSFFHALAAQPCADASSVKIEPSRESSTGYEVFTRFVGQLEFQPQEDYPKFYRTVAYSGDWASEKQVDTFSTGVCLALASGDADPPVPITAGVQGETKFSVNLPDAISVDTAEAFQNERAGTDATTSLSGILNLAPSWSNRFTGSSGWRLFLQPMGLTEETAVLRYYHEITSQTCGSDTSVTIGGKNNTSPTLIHGINLVSNDGVRIELKDEDTVKDAIQYASSRGGTVNTNYSGNSADTRRELNVSGNFEENGPWIDLRYVVKDYYFNVFDPFEFKAFDQDCGEGGWYEIEIHTDISTRGQEVSRLTISGDGTVRSEATIEPITLTQFNQNTGELRVRVELIAENDIEAVSMDDIFVQKTSRQSCEDVAMGDAVARNGSVDWTMQLGPADASTEFGYLRYYVRRLSEFDYDFRHEPLSFRIFSNLYSDKERAGIDGSRRVRSAFANSSDNRVIYVPSGEDDDETGYLRQIKTADRLVDVRTSIYDTYSLYEHGTSYSIYDKVIFDDRVYNSLHDTNENLPVIDGKLNADHWEEYNVPVSSHLTISIYDVVNPLYDAQLYLYDVPAATPIIQYVIDQVPGENGIRIRKYEEGVLDTSETVTYTYLGGAGPGVDRIELSRKGGAQVERQRAYPNLGEREIGRYVEGSFVADRIFSTDADGIRSYADGSGVSTSTVNHSSGYVLRMLRTATDTGGTSSWKYVNIQAPTGYDLEYASPWKNSLIDLNDPAATSGQHQTQLIESNVADSLTDGDGDGNTDYYDLTVTEVAGQEIHRTFDVRHTAWHHVQDENQVIDNRVAWMRSSITVPPGASTWDHPDARESVRYALSFDEIPKFADLPVCEIDLAEERVKLYRYPIPADSRHHIEVVYDGRVDTTLDRTTVPAPEDFISGTIRTTHQNSVGEVVLETTVDIQSGLTTYSKTAVSFEESDFEKRPTRYDYLDGTYETMSYACCGIDLMQDREGNVTDYDYDALGNVEYVTAYLGTPNQQVTRYKRNSVGDILETWIGPDTNNLVLASSGQFDLAGEATKSSEWFLDTSAAASDVAEGYKYSTYSQPVVDANGYTVQTITYHNAADALATVTEKRFRDGRLYERYGDAIGGGVRYDYTVETDPELGYAVRATKEIQLDEDGNETSEFTKTYTDAYGRTYKVERPNAATPGQVVSRRLYYEGASDQVVKRVDFDGTVTLYEEDFSPTLGEYVIEALDTDGSGTIELAGTDRIVRRATLVTTRSEDSVDYTVERSTLEVWPDSSASPETVSTTDQALDALASWSQSYAREAATTVNIDAANATRTVTTESNLGQRVVEIFVDGLLQDRDLYELDASPAGLVASTTNGYDAFRRLQTVTDNLRSTTGTYEYYQDGRLKKFTPPLPDAATAGETPAALPTDYHYVWPFDHDGHSGLLQSVDLPDGTSQKQFTLEGGKRHLTAQSDTQLADLSRLTSKVNYDYADRIAALTTYRDATDGTTAALTAWEYNPAGLLKQKWYDASIDGSGNISGAAGNEFTYTAAGRLATEENARGTTATFAYDPATGDLTGISYDDGLTPAVSYSSHDRLGRATQVTDASGTRLLDYENGQLLDETYTAGALDGYRIDRGLDGLDRLSSVALVKGDAPNELHQVDYLYDGASRLDTVLHRGHSVTYAYDPAAELRQTRSFHNGSANVLTVEERRDNLNRLKSLETNNLQLTTNNTHSYLYDNLNRRTRHTREDGSYWSYGYDSLGQVDSAVKYNSADTAIPGYDFGFTFDDIGNRESTSTNGRTAAYTPDELNQYDDRAVPRALDVRGKVVDDPAVTVTVNGNAATRLGGDFHRALDLSAGGNAAQEVGINVTATLPDGGDNNAPRIADADKSEYLPANPEAFQHDADGNLTQDGKWSYIWDAANRLIEMETLPAAVTAGAEQLKLEFAYDSEGRRFSKTVSTWDNTTNNYQQTTATLYVWDAYNLLYELTDLQNGSQTEKAYVWGRDLSGTMQGAGGVGGLLMVTHAQSSTYYPTYDGNGNIMVYYAADTGENVAEFEYGPFGETIRSTGVRKNEFDFRFSTKPTDLETGLVVYELRYYNSVSGRWLSRDPIGERGGMNLYGMVRNNAINRVDYLGLVDLNPLESDFVAADGVTYTINQDKLIDFVGEDCACRLKSVSFTLRGNLGNGNDDFVQDLDDMSDAVHQLSWMPTSINPLDFAVHLVGKVGGTPDASTAFDQFAESQRLLLNSLPQYDATTNIDYVVVKDYKRKFFIGPKDPNKPIYGPGPSTYRSYKKEFENNFNKALLYLKAGGDILDLKEEFPFQDAPVYNNDGSQTFNHPQNAFQAAYKQIEKQLKIICNR